jgi:hypothetical protein
VKCFSLLIFIFWSSVTLADSYLVMPKNKVSEEIQLGDILEIEVINQDNNTTELTSKRVGPAFYILETLDNKTYRVVVSPERKKTPTNTTDKVEVDKFEYRGFKFSKDLANLTNEYVFKKIDLELTKESKTKIYLTIIFILALIALYVWGPRLYNAYKKKRKIEARKKFLKSKIQAIKSRKDIEEIYKHKNEINELFNLENKVYKEFVNDMNQIQYKKSWSEEDKIIASKAVKNLREVANGI